MYISIHSETPLWLHRLLPVWQRMMQEQTVAASQADLWQRINRQAEAYRRYYDESFWQQEQAALQAIMSSTSQQVNLAVTGLVVPLDTPGPVLELLTGYEVRQWISGKEPLSPFAVLWLKELGAVTNAHTGIMAQVERSEEITLIRWQVSDKVVAEQHAHGDEHIDEGMLMIQLNLDDCSPEFIAYVMDKLLKAGANDVNVVPMTMKKSRSGVMVQVLCYRSQLEQMKHILFTETTTFGLRYFPVTCHRLARTFQSVKTPWGEIEVKLGYFRGKLVQVAPEYDQCAKRAAEAGVPIKLVYQTAVQLAKLSNEQEPDGAPSDC